MKIKKTSPNTKTKQNL